MQMNALRTYRIKHIALALLLPATAHIAGIGTIISVWFMKSGSFTFNVYSIVDWIYAATCGVVLLSGLVIAWRMLESPRIWITNRNQLKQLVLEARQTAEVSAISLAGDISWLNEDLDSLLSLRTQSPHIQITLHYDAQDLPSDALPSLKRIHQAGVILRPYPVDLKSSLRCLFVDMETDKARYFFYRKLNHGPLGMRDRDRFEFLDCTSNTDFVAAAAIAFLNLLNSRAREPVIVAISGVNNTGKTTLANRLRDLLRLRVKVEVVPDEFWASNGSTDEHSNWSILLAQALRELPKDCDIVIVDRPATDNLAYLQMRFGRNAVPPSIESLVAGLAKKTDLLIDVREPMSDYTAATTHMTGAQRAEVRRILDDFFGSYSIETRPVTARVSNIGTDIDRAASILSAEILDIYEDRSLQPNS